MDCSTPGASLYFGVCSNSCSLSWWCYPTISSSGTRFSFCLQSFPTFGSFPVSQLFTSGGQSIGVSASVSVLPMNIQGWLPLELTGLISLQSKGVKISPSITVQKHQFSGAQPSLGPNSHPYMTAGKTIALTVRNFVRKAMSSLFDKLSRFVIASKERLQSLSAVIWELKKIKSVSVSTFSPSFSYEVMRPYAMIFVFWMLNFKPAFHSPLSPSSRGCLDPLHFLSLEWYHPHIRCYWYFSWQSWLQLVSHTAQHFAWCSLHIS